MSHLSRTTACLWLGLICWPLQAGDFERDIRPIFAERCIGCHGPSKQRGNFRLDRRNDAIRGGDSGPAFTPGKSNESLLIQKVTDVDASVRMPPNGSPLTDDQIQKLRAWIDQGAVWPEDQQAPTHWSFRALKKPAVITRDSTGTRNAIDFLIRKKLAEQKLVPSAEAGRPTLIRRLKFDLVGLPPTPEEIDAFVNDAAPDAYEKLTDRLLASPQYGERWARHWLDVVRFAESGGYETNLHRPNAWPYRDYVIRAFNEDKPYDRFIAEQLAGDALGVDIATGFLVAGSDDIVKSPDIVLTRQQRADELHDMVATTGSTFLGLTVGCARCHHHKFDPVSQRDYYALKATLAGVHHGERPFEDPDGQRTRLARAESLQCELERINRAVEDAEPSASDSEQPRRPVVNALRNVERFQPVAAKYLRFTILATNNLEPCIDELEVFATGTDRRNVALAKNGTKASASSSLPNVSIHKLEHINDGQYGNSRSWISNETGGGWVQLEFAEPIEIDRVVWSRDRDGKLTDRLPTQYRIEVATDLSQWKQVASSKDRWPYSKEQKAVSSPLEAKRAEVEKRWRDALKPPMLYAGTFTTPEPTHRLHRGDPMHPREVVAPGGVEGIGGKFQMPLDAPDRERRLTLARWITDDAKSLTARVMVNRLWNYHFGCGLCDTPGDLGHHGGVPTHPELIDWLAAEFVEHHWSIKHIQRLIVTSATYRQSSAATPVGQAADAQCRLLWRSPLRRLEGETIRDTILSVSGSLDLRMGGPGFDLFEPNSNYVKVYTPKQTFGPPEFRRMIYQSRPRMQSDDTFGAFDCPDAGQIAPKRNVSTTPLQALNLLNSPFLLQQADLFAARLKKEAPDSPTDQVRLAFRLAFGRCPNNRESKEACSLIAQHGLPALCRAMFNANEFIYVE